MAHYVNPSLPGRVFAARNAASKLGRLEREETAENSVRVQLGRIYANDNHYRVRYPAAVDVLQKLGVASWRRLERYRWLVIEFTHLIRMLDRDEEMQVDESSLDLYLPKMQRYIRQDWGTSIEEKFKRLHQDFVARECILDEKESGDGIQIVAGDPAKNIQEMFRRRNLQWWRYNLYFPPERRMRWEQLVAWTIESLDRGLIRNPMDPPSWTSRFFKDEGVRLPQLSVNEMIWDEARVEVFTDLQRRFKSRPRTRRENP